MAGKSKDKLTIEQKEVIRKIGIRVKIIRKMKRITQEELAANANISVVNLIAIEKGERNFSMTTLYDIVNGLNISIENFFGFNINER